LGDIPAIRLDFFKRDDGHDSRNAHALPKLLAAAKSIDVVGA